MRALAAPAPARLQLPDAMGTPRARDSDPPARRSAAERLAADRAKYVRSPAPDGPHALAPAAPPAPGPGPGPARAPEPVARRVIARRPLRPDSLVMYRQKCDFARGPDAHAGLGRKLLPGPGRDRAALPGEEGRAAGPVARPAPLATGAPPAAPSPAPERPSPGPAPAAPGPGPTPAAPSRDPDPELRRARRAGLRRSQSDLSSRFSASLAEADAFFQFCGLDPDVVESLGRDNFSAGSERAARLARTLSVATSDSGFSRRSGPGEGPPLEEPEPAEPPASSSATSVVERNARIIKWLYSCRKAREAARPAPQGPA